MYFAGRFRLHRKVREWIVLSIAQTYRRNENPLNRYVREAAVWYHVTAAQECAYRDKHRKMWPVPLNESVIWRSTRKKIILILTSLDSPKTTEGDLRTTNCYDRA